MVAVNNLINETNFKAGSKGGIQNEARIPLVQYQGKALTAPSASRLRHLKVNLY